MLVAKKVLAVIGLCALPALFLTASIQNSRVGGGIPEDNLVRLSFITVPLLALGLYWIFARRTPVMIKLIVIVFELLFVLLNIGVRSVG